MAEEVENPLSKKDRRTMADLVRLIITTEDADIVSHLRDMASQDQHLLSARIRIETFELCDCPLEIQEANFTVNAVPDIVDAIVLGRCGCDEAEFYFGSHSKMEVSFHLIHVATLMNRKQTIKFLLSFDESLLNSQTGVDSERTPFFIALEKLDVQLMTYLIEFGADVNIMARQIGFSETPLLFAVVCGNWEIFQLLVSCPNCDVNGECDGSHALSVVAVQNMQRVKYLLQAGADPNRGLTNAVSHGSCEMLSALIEAGAKVDSTMLLDIVRLRKAEMCRVLLEAGVNPNAVPPGDTSALHVAALVNFTEIVQLLLRFGADPNQLDNTDYTPFHDAACEGYGDVMELLLDAGAEPDLRSKDGDTPLNLVAFAGCPELVEWLLSLGCNASNAGKNLDTALHYVADVGCLDAVRDLVAAGADPNAENMYHTTPLWYAVYNGHEDVVRYLVELNVNLSVPSVGLHVCDVYNWDEVPFVYDQPVTPLWVAVDRVFPEVVEVLLAGGCNIWREEWLGGFIDPDTFDDPVSLEMADRLSVIYSSPPSLLHLSTMFFRETFKLRLGAVIKHLPLPHTLKDGFCLRLKGV